MEVDVEMPLNELPNEAEAYILSLPRGESGRRLEAMGLRPGKKIRKVYGMPFHGPITISMDGRQIAIGHGISTKIMVRRAPKEENG